MAASHSPAGNSPSQAPSTPRPSRVRIVYSSPKRAERTNPKDNGNATAAEIATTLGSLPNYNTALLLVAASETAAEEKIMAMRQAEEEVFIQSWKLAYMILRELASKIFTLFGVRATITEVNAHESQHTARLSLLDFLKLRSPELSTLIPELTSDQIITALEEIAFIGAKANTIAHSATLAEVRWALAFFRTQKDSGLPISTTFPPLSIACLDVLDIFLHSLSNNLVESNTQIGDILSKHAAKPQWSEAALINSVAVDWQPSWNMKHRKRFAAIGEREGLWVEQSNHQFALKEANNFAKRAEDTAKAESDARKKLQESLYESEGEKRTLKKRVKTLEKKVDRLTDENTKLTEDNKRLNTKVDRLMDDNKKLTQDNKKLTEDNKRLNTKVDRLMDDNKKLTEDNRRLTAKVDQLITDNTSTVTLFTIQFELMQQQINKLVAANVGTSVPDSNTTMGSA